MDYAELKEWEEYFNYEPTMADRMETQLALFMQIVSGFTHGKPLELGQLMVCHLKRIKKAIEPKNKTAELWKQIIAIFGDKE